MLDDRRKFRRYAIFLDLHFKLPKGTNCLLGVIKDFSRKGFCFVSNNFNLRSYETINCEIKLPREDKLVAIVGITRWTKRINGNCLVGAELIEVDKEPIWKILGYAFYRWCYANGYITNSRR